MIVDQKIVQAVQSLCKAVENNYYKQYPDGTCNLSYDAGRRYIKIIQNHVGNTSVHAFVDAKTGDLLKAASWNAPAKGVRFNLLTDMKKLEQIADYAGSYLYKR